MKQGPAVDEGRVAWDAAFHLAEQVRRGGRPQAVPPTVTLHQGELQHGSPVMDCSSFYGMDVEYSSGYAVGGGLLFTAVGMAVGAASNAAARNRAERESMPQWRPMGRWPIVVTSQRLLAMINYQWNSWNLRQIISIQLDVPNRSMILAFEGSLPLMLRGPWVPWTGVVIAASMYGQPWPPGTVLPAAAAPQPVQPVQPRPQLPSVPHQQTGQWQPAPAPQPHAQPATHAFPQLPPGPAPTG